MKTLKLNNGHQIPKIGLGTYAIDKDTTPEIIKDAIDVGYRLFDCAWLYKNEEEIGIGLNAKIDDGTVKRDELFILTKLSNTYHEKKLVVPKLKEQLKSLNLDYVDLYLMHWPFGFKEDADFWTFDKGSSIYSDVDYLETWEAMEECVALGLTRSIGISNFNSEQITRLLNSATIKPVVNEVEVSPNVNNKRLIKFCEERDIVVVGYSPLGHFGENVNPDLPKPTIHDEQIKTIAKKHNKSPAQVILKYLINLGIVVVPKTISKARMIENMDLFNFELDSDDTKYIDSINSNNRVCLLPIFKDHKYYPFNIEF
ncbi:hypothetical protein FQA39_LY00188 [Lamprigera yunnana]|nr:hypothetical protein FQA39_LY00188 [Lamprigera yunnana]